MQPFLVANFQTGIDKALEPWLTPQDAFINLENGYIFRGVLSPRKGYDQLATGGENNYVGERSVIYKTIESYEVTNTAGGGLPDMEGTLTNLPLRPGSVVIVAASGEEARDDGLGQWTGDVTPDPDGSIDYNTGAFSFTWNVSPTGPFTVYEYIGASGSTTYSGTLSSIPVQPGSISITDGTKTVTDDGQGQFTGDVTPDPGGSINYNTGAYSFEFDGATVATVTASYNTPAGNPIMGIFNFINTNGERRLIVLDTEYGNRLNPTQNQFVPISLSTSLETALSGTTFTGDTTKFWSGAMYPDKDGNARLILVNNQDTPIFFDSSNTFKDYTSTTDNTPYTEPPTAFGGTLNTALHVFYINERLVFLRPTLNSVIRPQRILFSGINDSSGNGDKFDAASAGYIDIPDGSRITAAIQQNNSLVIWTTESIWVLSITTSADSPFSLRRLGDADYRGSDAPYSAVDWFSQAAAMGRYGITATDTRTAYRIDNKLPFFTIDEVEQDDTNFGKVTSGTSLEQSQWWMTYPTSDGSISDINGEVAKKILVYGFEEKNWMKYDIPINVLGQFKQVLDVPWDDVNNDSSAHPEWETWDGTQDIWDQFYGEQGRPFTVGGDQRGYIHRMNLGTNDICANILDVTYPSDLKTDIETDYDGYNVGDVVTFSNITGCEVDGVSILNGAEFLVSEVSGATITVDAVNTGATAYSEGGVVCEGFECEFITKPLNPFTSQNKKCKLHKVLFLVSQSESDFLVDFYDDRREQPYMVDVPVDMSNSFGNADKKWFSLTVNQVANFHRMRIHRRSTNQSGAIHAFMFLASPVGRLYT